MDSRITKIETIEAPFASRGLIYQPLRDANGNLLTDLDGNILYEITARYQSVITEDSFITTTI